MRKKRILFVGADLGGGGAEKVVVTLLEHLDRSKYDLGLALFRDSVTYGASRIYSAPSDVEVMCLGQKNAREGLLLPWRLGQVYKRWEPHVVLSFLTFANVVAILGQRTSRCKFRLLISEHAVPSLAIGRNRSILALLTLKFMPRRLYPSSDRVVCVSKGVGNDVQETYRIRSDKISVIDNPIDLDLITTLAGHNFEHRWFQEREQVIVSVGRLTAVKGYPHLLRAFSRLIKQCPSRLIVIGDGEERERLATLASELRIEKRVEFLGFQPNPYQYMAKADVFVFPSLAGEFGNVVKEAMACGTPVVSMHYPEEPDTIITHERNGLLVPQGDEQLLTEAILRILTDKALARKLAISGRERAEDFSIQTIISKYEQLFD